MIAHTFCGDGVSNDQPHDCLLKRLFRHRSKKTSKLRVTGLCEGNSPVTGEFPAQRASNAENVSIWWRHHITKLSNRKYFWWHFKTRLQCWNDSMEAFCLIDIFTRCMTFINDMTFASGFKKYFVEWTNCGLILQGVALGLNFYSEKGPNNSCKVESHRLPKWFQPVRYF